MPGRATVNHEIQPQAIVDLEAPTLRRVIGQIGWQAPDMERLDSLRHDDVPDDDKPSALITALAGFGTLVAALFFVAVPFAAEWVDVERNAWHWGLAQLVGVLALRRLPFLGRTGFAGRLLDAASLAGQCLVLIGWLSELEPFRAAAAFTALQLALLFLERSRLQAFFSMLGVGAMAFHLSKGVPSALDWTGVQCVLWIGLLLRLPRVAPGLLSSQRRGAALLGMLTTLAFYLSGIFAVATAGSEVVGPWTTLALLGLMACGAPTAWRQWRDDPRLLIGGGVALLLVAGICLAAPGVLAALCLLIYGLQRQSPRILGAGMAFLLVYLWVYYYTLTLTLRQKSAVMVLTALALLVAYGLLRGPQGLRLSGRSRESWRRNLPFMVAVLLVLLVPGQWILSQESRWRAGEPMLLQLEPVDPRSLMQGDYMRLRFQIESVLQAQERPGENHPTRRWGRLVVRLDARGVAEFARIHDPEIPLAENERLLRYRGPDGSYSLGHRTFLFEEGRGDHLQGARYAQLRVDREGRSVLTALHDEELNRLAGR